MFKTFAAALAPIVALAANKGLGNGIDRDNAAEIVLIPNTLSLFTYNLLNGTTDEFHGDLSWTVAKPVAPATVPAATSTYNQWVEYGFCFRNAGAATTAATAATVWDCLNSRADVLNPTPADAVKTATWSSTFLVTDKSFTGSAPPASTAYATSIVNDPEFETTTDASISWVTVGQNNAKTNCAQAVAAAGTTPATYWCENLNTHYFRNFSTKDTSKDAQISGVDDKWQFFGYAVQYPAANWTGTPKITIGTVQPGTVVYQAYLDKKVADAAAKAAADAAAAKAAADAAAAAKAAAAKKDASSVTTCAVALAATMYALSF